MYETIPYIVFSNIQCFYLWSFRDDLLIHWNHDNLTVIYGRTHWLRVWNFQCKWTFQSIHYRRCLRAHFQCEKWWSTISLRIRCAIMSQNLIRIRDFGVSYVRSRKNYFELFIAIDISPIENSFRFYVGFASSLGL